MKQKFFSLTLLSDIVLQKSSNTQGKNESRDFINGSVILGIVAKHYNEFSNPFAIFHSGAVRFGEAKPLISGKISHKIPLCFFAPKEAKDLREVYNALFCDFATKSLQELQLRQIRSGYINEDLQKAELKYRYTQKVNLKNGKDKSTKDNQMFGYEAICEGAVFGFVVEFDECVSNDDIEKITQILCGTHFIGKSKNAEYGEVLIQSINDFRPTKHDLEAQDFSQDFNQDFNQVALYVASSLALFDNTMPTFIPNAKNLGLDSAQILWEKTHIKTKIHTPYNQKRKAKDSAKLIIEQGSVITLHNLSQSDKDKLKNGRILCGGFLSEGYGKILVNPSFLMQGKDNKPFALNQSHIDSPKGEIFTPQNNLDNDLIAYVKDLRDLQMREVECANAIDDFIAAHKGKFSKVTNAQWGAIRAFAQMADDKALKNRIICYINEERLKDKWEEGKEILEQFINAYDRDFIALLATRMPKADLDLSQNLAQESVRNFARKSDFRIISGGSK